MKAVIVEIKDNVVAVLSDDGCIVTAKNNNYEIGQVIQMSNPRIHFTKKFLAFAISAAALVVLSVGTWAYASPYTYVSLDVNPSIEYTVNRFDRVLSVRAVNDDGEEIIREISLENLKNETIQEALAKTVDQISELGYFDGNIEGGIIIVTSGKDTEKAEELAQELQQTVEDEVAENGDIVKVEAISVGLERVEQARELGVTPGKLNLVEKLQAAATDSTTIVLDEWLSKPVKEIMKATKDFKKPTAVSGSAITVQEKEINKEDKATERAKEVEEKAAKKEIETQDNSKSVKEKSIEKVENAKLEADKAELKDDKTELMDNKTELMDNKAETKNATQKAKVEVKGSSEEAEKANEANEEIKEETDKTNDKDTDEANKSNDNAVGKNNSSNKDTAKPNGISSNSKK